MIGSLLVISILSGAFTRSAAAEPARPVKRAKVAAPLIEVTEVHVEGPLTAEQARRAVESRRQSFGTCWAADEPGTRVERRVELRLLVLPTGKVSGATVERPLSEATSKLRRCVQRQALNVRFPSTKGTHSTVRLTLGEALFMIIGVGGNADAIRGLASSIHGSSVVEQVLSQVSGVAVASGPPQPPSGEQIRGDVILGSPRVSGPLGQAEVTKTLRLGRIAYRACYERVLRRNPALTGRVVLDFTIGGGGRVSAARVAMTTLSNSEVEQCLVGRIRSLRFDPPTGGGETKVSAPLLFKRRP